MMDDEYDPGHPIWRFSGEGEVKANDNVYFHLYRVEEDGTATHVGLDETDDVEFLHFYYNSYILYREDVRQAHLVLCLADFNERFCKKDLSHNMFFVYFTVRGTPASDTPCRFDEKTTVGVTFDYNILYQNAMGFTRELADTCTVPQGFIDFILNMEALRMSVETEHYIPAISHFKWMMGQGAIGTGNSVPAPKPCGCGR